MRAGNLRRGRGGLVTPIIMMMMMVVVVPPVPMMVVVVMPPVPIMMMVVGAIPMVMMVVVIPMMMMVVVIPVLNLFEHGLLVCPACPRGIVCLKKSDRVLNRLQKLRI